MSESDEKTQPPCFFYRFRSVDALLGERKELENQEIYFCPPDQLNDPMEGYKDLFWRGDEIVWRNLLKHYLAYLTQSLHTAFIMGKDYDARLARNFVFTMPSTLPTEQIKGIHRRVCDAFFGFHTLADLPAMLASRTSALRREEVEFCLRAVHGIALKCVMTILREGGRLPDVNEPPPVPQFTEEDVLKNLFKVLNGLKENEVESKPEMLVALFGASAHANRQIDLIRYLGVTDGLSKAWHTIFYALPEHYVDSLRDLVYFNWYAACFVTDPTHAAMWGHYGDGHKGICLKFRAEEREGQPPVLKLHGITGWHGGPNGGGQSYGDILLPFERITYTDKLPEVDFFRSIGHFPVPVLESQWYSDEQGNRSSCADDVLGNMSEWHQRYWISFRRLIFTKLRDWQHEDEYRLTLMSPLDSFSEAKDRKLKYRFSDLEGIIFGIRTPLAEKARIIDIVAAKCKAEGRKSFAFSQAVYAAHNGKIEAHPLDLVQFN
ncbi:MAG: DUF2971 domain-containing protein [Acidithiobacillus sp.]